MCLPVSRLFWVSSLAYPNLLGTKGYVVVVVVVVIRYIGENHQSTNYKKKNTVKERAVKVGTFRKSRAT
jgi:hypothetical protein